jgi:hypothetical protein
MELNKGHAQAVTDLMRTRFPLRGGNHRKNGRTFLPRWGTPQGEHSAPYGRFFPTRVFDAFRGLPEHTFEPLVQLYVYDEKEPDRPMMVRVDDITAARDYVRVLSEFIAHVESTEAN